jgi:hypothetical protein
VIYFRPIHLRDERARRAHAAPLITRSVARLNARLNAASSLLFVVALFACMLAAHPASAQGIGTSSGGDVSRASSASARGTLTVRVLDDASQPVRNATVLAFRQGQPPQSSRPSYDNSAATSGRYVISNLEPGIYSISINAPGYVQEFNAASTDADAPNLNAAPSLYRPGDSVTLRVVKGGVITGRVIDADGNPLVGARVTAVRLRDITGRALQRSNPVRERRTDDRGIYRLYGLAPGSYVVLAGGKAQINFTGRATAYDADAPTFYPSTTRDGAVELQVQTGQELTDIDIRYRGDHGHSVGGTVVGLIPSGQPGSGVAFATLTHSATGALEAQAFVQADSPTHSFSLEGIADGEYELSATTPAQNDNSLLAVPQHVSVRGADVLGLRLTLTQLGSLAGRISFEPLKAADATKPECQTAREFVPQEMLIFSRRESNDAAQQNAPFSSAQVAPDAKGEFKLRNLRDGRQRLNVRLIDENFYVRALTLPSTTPAPVAATTNARAAATPTTNDLARNGFTLKPGEQLAGALVQIAAGAASLRGRVAASEGESLPDNLHVYLVPAERERAEDVLRYRETNAQPDGAFAFKNLAPGSYFLLTRVLPDTDARQSPTLPLALDPNARAALRRDAEAAKTSIELQPCQRAADFTLRFARPGTN